MDKRAGMVIVTLVAVLALTISVVAAGPTLAGNGQGKGNGNNQQTATLWVEPANPFPAWGFDFAVRGSGFAPNSIVYISLTPNGATSNVLADSNGDIGFGWSTGAPGTYTFSAYQDLQGNRWRTSASVNVSVVE